MSSVFINIIDAIIIFHQKQLEAVLKQNKELISTVQQLVAQVHALHSQRHTLSTSHGLRLSSSTSSSMSSTPTLTPKHMPLTITSGEKKRFASSWKISFTDCGPLKVYYLTTLVVVID